ncbi:MAG: hypothetical protein RBU30_18890 [Polyangia bacterium]|nr:hypothetical protein [Polyangia bacterium]
MRHSSRLGWRPALQSNSVALLWAFALMGALTACHQKGIGALNENSSNQNQNGNLNVNSNLNENGNENQHVTPVEVLLNVYADSGRVVQTFTMLGMGTVTIAPPTDEPGPSIPTYVVMAQAAGHYTQLYPCSHGDTIDVQLGQVPVTTWTMTGVVIRMGYFGPPAYHAEQPLIVTDPSEQSLTVYTDAQGRYLVTHMETGTFRFEVQCNAWEEPLPRVFDVPNDGGTSYKDLFYDVDMSADAPNIYLSPAQTTDVTVALGFPLGGEVVLSDPPYEGGWEVTVEPDGTIEGEYPYLFYEARLPYRVQRETGWVLPSDGLETGLGSLLASYGFMGREVTDFLEYWLPRMTGAPYWGIHPMPAEELVTLAISPAPDRLRRLWLFMEPLDAPMSVTPPPAPAPLPRDGFTAVEWGAFLGR